MAIAIHNFTDIQNMSNDLTETYYLAGDIDCTGHAAYTPVGNTATPFTGTLEGNGYTISNLTIDGTNDVGLFGSATGVTISNLIMDSCTITVTDPGATSTGVGTLVGTGKSICLLNCGVTSGTFTLSNGNFDTARVGGLIGGISDPGTNINVITDCYTKDLTMNVTADRGDTDDIGGLVGKINGSYAITNSYTLNTTMTLTIGSTSGSSVWDCHSIGGFIGEVDKYSRWVGTPNYGTITDCYAENISLNLVVNGEGITNFANGIQHVGGFIGETGGFSIPRNNFIRDCWSSGSINLSGDLKDDTGVADVGGFAGSMDTYSVECCYSTVDINITSTNHLSLHRMGGFVGAVTTSLTIIKNCYATGNITATADEYPAATGVSSALAVAGGFAGKLQTAVEILNCYCTGNITLKIEKGGIGGFAAEANNRGAIINCYSKGALDVTAFDATKSAFVGGFVGNLGDVRLNLLNCYSVGTITIREVSPGDAATFYAGGFVGNIDNTPATFSNCSWWTGSTTNAIGSLGQTGGSIALLATNTYGTDEGTIANFYSTTHAVYG